MLKYESQMDHADPFSGGRKASLAAFIYALSLLPWLAQAPFLPYLMWLTWSNPNYFPEQVWMRILLQISGILILACSHFGGMIGRLSGFSSELDPERKKKDSPPRVWLTSGIILQIPFYFGLYFAVQQLSAPSYDDLENEISLFILFGTAALLGIGQQAVAYSVKQYVYTCSFKDETSNAFVRRTENLVNFAGMVAVAWSGCYYWFHWVDYNTTVDIPEQVNNYCYINMAPLMVAFVLSLALPRAPYSDHMIKKKSYNKDHNEGCSKGCGHIMKQFFSFRMIKFVPHIALTASLIGIYESVVFSFLSFNTYDKTDSNPMALPFMVLIAYYGSMFIMSLGQCKRCFEHSEYLNRGTRVCGAAANFFILIGVLALIAIGALADNDIIFPDAGLIKNFSLYIFAGLAIGITQVILRRQRKSLILKHPVTSLYYPEDLAFLDATSVMEDLLIILYQSILVAILYNLRYKDPWNYEWLGKVRSMVFYEIVPFQLVGTMAAAIGVQLLICMCF